jgi:cellulose synthase/poly-beta-1,6-N-acetylglucosamine synthase-like glycosyltransferase
MIHSMSDIDYPKEFFEIIFVNDNSKDGGEKLIEKYLGSHDNFKILNINNNIPSKKNAIHEGIKQSKFDWIVQTDADCTINSKWLKCFNQIILENKGVKFITAPVIFSNVSLLANIQYLESFALMAGTSFGLKYNIPQMANAANMCWSKSVLSNSELEEVYNSPGTSGDDYYLMMKIYCKNKKLLKYANFKEIIVTSKSQTDIKSFARQRLRWVSKYGSTQTIAQKVFPLGIWLFHFMILIFLIYFVLSGDFLITVLFFLLKLAFEFFYIRRISSLYDLPISKWDVFLQQLIYTPYTIFFGIGSLFAKDQWK